MKDLVPDLTELDTPEGQAKLEEAIEAGLERVKKVVTGPAKEVEEEAQTEREAVTLPEDSKLAEKLRLVEKTLLIEPEDLIKAVDKIYKELKKNDIVTRADFNALLDQFPGLQNNNTFFKKLRSLYPEEVGTDMDSDNDTTSAPTAEEDIKEAYNDLNPKECNIP